jgi:hypothetical protein
MKHLLDHTLCCNKSSSSISTVFLESFAYEDREGAFRELCRLLKELGGEKQLQLLDCTQWAPELSGAVVCWWKDRGAVFLISPSGRTVNWRKLSAAVSGGQEQKQYAEKCVLHTYTVTRLNEGWMKTIEKMCSRI